MCSLATRRLLRAMFRPLEALVSARFLLLRRPGFDDLDFPLKAILQVVISVDRLLPGRGSDGGIGLENGLVFEQRLLVALHRRNPALWALSVHTAGFHGMHSSLRLEKAYRVHEAQNQHAEGRKCTWNIKNPGQNPVESGRVLIQQIDIRM
jgi:hypothetical protein